MKQNENNILNFQFSLIGRIDSIYNNINKLTDIFAEYNQRNIQLDLKPNSIPTNCYIMMNNVCSISIHENRIDFGVKVFDSNSKTYFYKFLDSLKDNKFDIDISRIAINYNYFVDDTDGNLSQKIISKTNIFTDENKPEKLLLQLNFPFNINDIKFNNLISLEKNIIQNNKTFEKIGALIILIDINSSVEQKNSFSFDNIKTFYDEMILKVNTRVSEIDTIIRRYENE